ncbi:MAG: methylenetetrahydrofolate reductase, partial [Dehalococcoidia bacterium]
MKVTERCFETTGHTTFICDFSPPRGGDPDSVVQPDVNPDFISVAYNPGKAVRVNSAMLAASIKNIGAREVTFTLATRDMNKLALQSLLLGAQLLGLENVVVVQGDPFTQRDLQRVKDVGDFTATGLIAAIAEMNRGTDYREGRLRAPSDFCIGATLDLTRDI